MPGYHGASGSSWIPSRRSSNALSDIRGLLGSGSSWLVCSCIGWCYTEKPLNAWQRQETQRQDAPRIGTNELTYQVPCTIERLVHNSSRIGPARTAVMHVSSTAISHHHYAHTAGSPPDPLCQRCPIRSTSGLSHTTPQTPPAPAGTRCALSPEGIVSSLTWWAALDARRAAREGGIKGSFGVARRRQSKASNIQEPKQRYNQQRRIARSSVP